jgi:triphosphatase
MRPEPLSAPDSTPARGKSSGDAAGEAREVEWQLAATDLGEVRRWLGRHSVVDGLRIERVPAQQLHDTYLDTEDWRLYRAGFALRLREKEGRVEATLKGLRSAREEVADRRELTEPLAAGRVKALARADGPVGSRVRDVIGVKPLRKLFEVRTSRERFAVRSREPAEEVGELALDEAQFSGGNAQRRPMILTRVELEAVGSSGPALEHLAARLRTECGLQTATKNKFAAGLHSASLEPPQSGERGQKPDPACAPMRPSSRAAEFAAAALRRLLEEWQAHEPAARLGENPEALHALRVTVRRMDTVLSLFRTYLPAALTKSQPKLRRLLDTLGTVRDFDIRLEAVNTYCSELPEGDRSALDSLLRHLEAERGQARATMLRALDAKSTRHWLEGLSAQLARPLPVGASASRYGAAALRVVPDLIRRHYRKLRKCARQLTPESSLSQFHKVRVRTKKLRYMLEMVAPTYGEPADTMLAALLKLQSRLGTQHDADVVAHHLTELAAHPPASLDSRTLFLMGRLAELHARETREVGGKIEKPWRKVRGKRWKALRARMKELRDDLPESNGLQGGIDDGAGGDATPTGISGRSAAADAGGS